jgi:ubiquinone/menaquinone biosynthesis C-methylase UbiE
MLAQGQAIDLNASLSLRYVNARAEDTGLLSASFDIVTAGTCWHWFNRPAAARESRPATRQR